MIRTYGNSGVNKETYIDNSAQVIGQVSIGKDSSVWPCAVIRADIEQIKIGSGTNIQDNVTIHASRDFPVNIGNNVSIGHNAVLHGCIIKDNCLIGMGSIIMNGVLIKNNCMIAAGAVVTEKKIIPENSLVVGVPGKIVRELTDEEIKGIKENSREYIKLMKNLNQHTQNQ